MRYADFAFVKRRNRIFLQVTAHRVAPLDAFAIRFYRFLIRNLAPAKALPLLFIVFNHPLHALDQILLAERVDPGIAPCRDARRIGAEDGRLFFASFRLSIGDGDEFSKGRVALIDPFVIGIGLDRLPIHTLDAARLFHNL